MTNYEGNLQNFRDVLICQEIYRYWKILITHFLDGIFEWINSSPGIWLALRMQTCI